MSTVRLIGFLSAAMLGLIGLVGCGVHTSGSSGGTSVQGSGVVKSETRTVSGFNAVALNGIGKVVVTQDGQESVTVSAEDNLLPLLLTHVDNGTLRLEVAPDTDLHPTKPIEFDVHAKKLTSLNLEGAGDMQASQLAGNKLAVSLSGAGNITLAGQVAFLSLVLNGAGNFSAEDLHTQRATVNSSGAGKAVVNVSQYLTVSLAGVGNVEYIGSPKVQQSIAGIGKVTHRE